MLSIPRSRPHSLSTFLRAIPRKGTTRKPSPLRRLRRRRRRPRRLRRRQRKTPRRLLRRRMTVMRRKLSLTRSSRTRPLRLKPPPPRPPRRLSRLRSGLTSTQRLLCGSKIPRTSLMVSPAEFVHVRPARSNSSSGIQIVLHQLLQGSRWRVLLVTLLGQFRRWC